MSGPSMRHEIISIQTYVRLGFAMPKGFSPDEDIYLNFNENLMPNAQDSPYECTTLLQGPF
jgi:hypothetical protein